MIPYSTQKIDKKDIQEVINTLKSPFLTQGPKVTKFEKALTIKVDARYAASTNSATSALHIACIALGVGAGDLVWTSPITFVASANCALYCGAEVDFVDIDFDTNNMSPSALRLKLQHAKALGRLPKVVIPVHMGGLSCDMKSIFELSQEYGFKIIEDASHAIGGSFGGSKIGSCEYSDIAVFSFHPVKIITTAEGGAALTNNARLGNKLALLRSHGVTRDIKQMENVPDGDWYYEQISLGFNYRMTDLHAALGCSQMKRLDDFVLTRNKVAQRYNKKLSHLPLDLPSISSGSMSSFHLYIIKISQGNESERRNLFDFLRHHNIGVNVHYIPVHLQPYYKRKGFSEGDLPISELYYKKAISIPLYPNLSVADQDHIVSKLCEFFA